MPTIHITQDLSDKIKLRKHPGQTPTGFLSELYQKHYPDHKRNNKGQFLSPDDPPIKGGNNAKESNPQTHLHHRRHNEQASTKKT